MYICKRKHAYCITHKKNAKKIKIKINRAYFAFVLVHHSNHTDADGIPLGLHRDTAGTKWGSNGPGPLCSRTEGLGLWGGCFCTNTAAAAAAAQVWLRVTYDDDDARWKV